MGRRHRQQLVTLGLWFGLGLKIHFVCIPTANSWLHIVVPTFHVSHKGLSKVLISPTTATVSLIFSVYMQVSTLNNLAWLRAISYLLPYFIDCFLLRLHSLLTLLARRGAAEHGGDVHTTEYTFGVKIMLPFTIALLLLVCFPLKQ